MNGSSPRAWGIRMDAVATIRIKRFIPTCVGNTRAGCVIWRRMAVHPHVRGEYWVFQLAPFSLTGSSPRAWGIHTHPASATVATRFIPTCVGNTYKGCIPARFASVHPHVRGEYMFSTTDLECSPGSSPRAWGIPFSSCSLAFCSRFIPTCVGNTSRFRFFSFLLPVHPHVRGEYLSLKISTINALNTTLKSTEAFLANPAGSEQEKTRPSPLVPCNSFRSSQRKIPIHYGNSRP